MGFVFGMNDPMRVLKPQMNIVEKVWKILWKRSELIMSSQKNTEILDQFMVNNDEILMDLINSNEL